LDIPYSNRFFSLEGAEKLYCKVKDVRVGSAHTNRAKPLECARIPRLSVGQEAWQSAAKQPSKEKRRNTRALQTLREFDYTGTNALGSVKAA